jgi:aminoglycoside/choline kinase family phosphotransferase
MTEQAPGVRCAMILAAGLGTRLRPLTDATPKPLMQLGGRPLLARIAARLRDAGVRRLAVNAHHLPQRIADASHALEGFDEIRVFFEPAILGTAGGIAGAREFFRGEPHVLLHNGDVDADVELGVLVADHLASGAAATLLLVDWAPVNSVLLGGDGVVRDVGGRAGATPCAGDRALTYTGVAVLAARFLDDLPDGPGALADALLSRIAREPDAVRGVAPAGLRWSDLGTPGRYLESLLALDDPADADAAAAAVAALPVVRAHGWGGAAVARLAPEGSDRGFWRLRRDGDTAVLMKDRPRDPEFDRAVAVAAFLHAEGLGGAAVLGADREDSAALMEDLGDDSLHRLAHAPGADRAALYGPVVDLLAELQARGTARSAACPASRDRVFGREDLLAETAYFRRRFLLEDRGLPEADLAALDPEFAALADAVAAQPRALMHRDFQSRNILLRDGHVRLVDVQGMRLGPCAYDLMSLLRDAYVDLGDGLREALLDRFARASAAAGGPAPRAAADLRRDATLAGLQRVMQALGAFAFLSNVKGKQAFRSHIPLACRHLRDLLAELDRCPPPAPRMANLQRIVAIITIDQ